MKKKISARGLSPSPLNSLEGRREREREEKEKKTKQQEEE